MPKFTTNPQPAPQSDARRRLAFASAARLETTATIERLRAALARLTAAKEIDGRIVGALANLDAAEAAAMNDWARSGEGDAPTPDAKKREAMSRAMADARAKADSAARAEPSLAAECARESAKLPAIAREIDLCIGEIAVEEAERLLPDYVEAAVALAAKAVRIEQVREILMAMARAAGEGEPGRPFYVLQEAFNTRFSKVSGRLAPDLDQASQHRLGWHALLEQLRSGDASATLSEASA